MTLERWAVGQERHILAGVICSGISWVIAMVGSDEEQIILLQGFQNFSQASIKLLQAIPIASWVAAVAIYRIKIH